MTSQNYQIGCIKSRQRATGTIINITSANKDGTNPMWHMTNIRARVKNAGWIRTQEERGRETPIPLSLFSVVLKSNLNKSELGETFCLVSDKEPFAYDVCNLSSLLSLLPFRGGGLGPCGSVDLCALLGPVGQVACEGLASGDPVASCGGPRRPLHGRNFLA